MRDIKANLNFLMANYKIESFLFLTLFAIIFPMISFSSSPASDNNVEQWINLTNQMFYGSQDFMFSYGPMFWITGGTPSIYSAPAYLLAMFFGSLVYTFFWTLILSLVYRHNAFIFFAILFILFFKSLVLAAAFYLWPLAILYYLEFSKNNSLRLNPKILVVLGLFIGSFFYIRFFYGLLPLLLFGSYFVSNLFLYRNDKTLLYFLPTVVIGYLLTGLLIFNDSSNVINYLLINGQLNFGNSVDMTLDITNTIACFSAIAIAFLSVNIYLFLERKILILPVNIAFLIFFKMGFSRADHYATHFLIPIFVLGMVMLLSNRKIGKYLFFIFFISIGYIAAFPAVEGDFGGSPYKYYNMHTSFDNNYTNRMSNTYGMYKLDDNIVKKIGNEPIDVYPYNNEYIFANKLNYKYRPNFQNFMTLTPKLDKMNLAFFESSESPRFILWTAGMSCWGNVQGCNPFNGFDGKYALNEDPLTSTSILLNYHLVDHFSGKNGVPLILLEKNEKISKYTPISFKKQLMEFGKWYDVPESKNGVTKVIPNLNFTLFGRAKNLLFRGDILYISYKLNDGDVKKYRVNILNSNSGVWVSPYLLDFKFNSIGVSKIMFETNGNLYFEPTFESAWIHLPIQQPKLLDKILLSNINDANWIRGISKDGYKFLLNTSNTHNIEIGNSLQFNFSGQRKIVALEQHGEYIHVVLDQPINPMRDDYPNLIK